MTDEPLLSQQDSIKELSDYASWDPVALSEYLETVGLGDYSEVVINHKITGKLLPLVTNQDLVDMGISIVGDRLRFRKIIESFGRKTRRVDRTKTIWEGSEKLYWGWLDEMLQTGCGCCPHDPNTYKLTQNHLIIKTVQPQRLGPIQLCCCYSFKVDNVDLTRVTDTDVHGIPAPCILQVLFCAGSKDEVHIDVGDDETFILSLEGGDGRDASNFIMNQVEEAQVMERD